MGGEERDHLIGGETQHDHRRAEAGAASGLEHSLERGARAEREQSFRDSHAFTAAGGQDEWDHVPAGELTWPIRAFAV